MKKYKEDQGYHCTSISTIQFEENDPRDILTFTLKCIKGDRDNKFEQVSEDIYIQIICTLNTNTYIVNRSEHYLYT